MLQSLLGIITLTGIAWLLSEQRHSVSRRVSIAGLLTQLLLALVLFKLPSLQQLFVELNRVILALNAATEAGTALLLLWIRPSSVPFAPGLIGLILLAVVWLSTYLWQVPLHRQLAVEYQVDLIRRLVRSNWLRTFAWTSRGMIVVWLAASPLGAL